MPHLTKREVAEVIGRYSPPEQFFVFIETGTLIGQTIFEMESIFKTLHTIELNPQFYQQTRARYKGEKIKFHKGDSAILLPEIVKNITKNSVLWLDGHYSSGRTSRGSKDVPLLEELEGIEKYLRPAGIIIIDDFRLFGTSHAEDWGDITLENVLRKLGDRVIEYYNIPSKLHPKDRLVVNISKIQKNKYGSE